MIDAHVHIFPRMTPWNPHNCHAAENETHGSEAPAYTDKDLARDMQTYGVEGAVVLAGPAYGDWNAYTIEAMNAPDSRIIAAAAFFDPWVDKSEEWYARDIASSPFKAVKLECSSKMGLCSLHKWAKLDDEPVMRLCQRMEQEGKILVLDLGKPGTSSYQTEQVAKLAETYPQMQIVVCHIGQPDRHLENDALLMQAWERQVSLGKKDNVWLDFSALPCFMLDEELPVKRAAEYVHRVAEIAGTSKLMWGSDVPWLSRKADYGQMVELAYLYTTGFSENERQKLLCDNAKRLWLE